MVLCFITEEGREVHQPPYTKAEQMEMYKRYAEGPKVMVKQSPRKPEPLNEENKLDNPKTTHETQS